MGLWLESHHCLPSRAAAPDLDPSRCLTCRVAVILVDLPPIARRYLLRFHSRTWLFATIRQRIEASSLRRLDSGRNIWIPLDVPHAVSAEEMVDAIVAQAEEVMRVAYQSE